MIIKLIVYYIVSVTLLNWATAARILCIYMAPSESHVRVQQILTENLHKKGHELVVITPRPPNSKFLLENVTEINTYSSWKAHVSKSLTNRSEMGSSSSTYHPITLWEYIYSILYSKLDSQFSHSSVQALIRDPNEKFDLIIAEAIFRPSFILSARFKAPVILLSTFYGTANNFNIIGAPVDSVFYPDLNALKSWKLNFWDRLDAAYTYLRLRFMGWQMRETENTMIKKHFGDSAPTMDELEKNVQMLFLNVHPIWDHNRPVSPSVLYFGALHLKEQEPLPQDIKTFLDSSKNGVIYISFGSCFKSIHLPKETVKLIMNVLGSLPYDVLWKWEGEAMPGKPLNIRLEKWLPQNDLLRHRSIKAFITQAGLQSTDEAIAAHVPLVALPIYADQFLNAHKYQQFGIGIQLDINNLDEVDFRKAVIEVAEGKSYRDNINRLSRIMALQRAGALERGLQWIDRITKNGPQNLISPLANISFAEYYMLDVFGLIVLAFFIVITFLLKILCK